MRPGEIMEHSAYFIAKQAAKGADIRRGTELRAPVRFVGEAAAKRGRKTCRGKNALRGGIDAKARETAAERPISERARKRIVARAQRIAKERVYMLGMLELACTNYLWHYRDEAGPAPRHGNYEIYPDEHPLVYCSNVMADIGISLVRDIKTIADPYCRAEIKNQLIRGLRKLRRPFYYARETERRRLLALQRRKAGKRRTTAPAPTPEELMSAWEDRKTSKAAMLRLGALLVDLSCHVDSCLRFDEYGNVIGRNGGIRGWLADNAPDLYCKYKTLMRYKEMAEKLRQATDTHDPTPTSALFAKPHPVVAEILAAEDNTFVAIERVIAVYIDPDKALDIPLAKTRGNQVRADSGPPPRKRSGAFRR